jgi:hypothetical protein
MTNVTSRICPRLGKRYNQDQLAAEIAKVLK